MHQSDFLVQHEGPDDEDKNTSHHSLELDFISCDRFHAPQKALSAKSNVACGDIACWGVMNHNDTA